MQIDTNFTSCIVKDQVKGGWTYILWSESSKVLGTRQPVKVMAAINDITFQVTCMPMGDGSHMVPLRKDILEQSQVNIGDEVTLRIWKKDEK